jgi:hypothetical protein
MDSPPASFPSTVGVATLTESLFSAKAHTLFLRKVAKVSQCVLQALDAWGESFPPWALQGIDLSFLRAASRQSKRWPFGLVRFPMIWQVRNSANTDWR